MRKNRTTHVVTSGLAKCATSKLAHLALNLTLRGRQAAGPLRMEKPLDSNGKPKAIIEFSLPAS